MKIGTSLGKCLKDLLDGTVDYDDVLVIVSNTNIDTIEQMSRVVEAYHSYPAPLSRDISNHSLDQARKIGIRLLVDGKLHQPRKETGNQHGLRDTWYDIVPSTDTDHESVVEAYRHYRMLAELVK